MGFFSLNFNPEEDIKNGFRKPFNYIQREMQKNEKDIMDLGDHFIDRHKANSDNCNVCGKFVKNDDILYCDACENPCHRGCGIYNDNTNECVTTAENDNFTCQKCLDEYEEKQREADEEISEFDNW